MTDEELKRHLKELMLTHGTSWVVRQMHLGLEELAVQYEDEDLLAQAFWWWQERLSELHLKWINTAGGP